MAEKKVEGLLKTLRTDFHKDKKDLKKCKSTLSAIKIQLIHFKLTPPFEGSEAKTKKQLMMAREALEIGVLLSIESGDEAAFTRYFNQVKVYYTDYAALLPVSERQWTILGLNLMCLLSQEDSISEFHSDLELISLADQANAYVQYPVELEQRLMEGSYARVLAGRSSLPDPHFEFFFDRLSDTVREKIADCTEQSYESVPVAEVAQMLMLEKNKVKAYCAKREWAVEDGGKTVRFTSGADKEEGIPSHSMIEKTLSYATELERIV
jgi:26S proteasome regulatory subunit N12